MTVLRRIWNVLFQDELGDIPSSFSDRCCAQFLVHRDKIRSHPLLFYANILKYTYDEDAITADHYHSDMSYAMEYIWHYLFGEPAISDGTYGAYNGIRFKKSHEYGDITYFL